MKRRILALGCSFLLAACAQQDGPDESASESAVETTGMEAQPDPSAPPAGEEARADIRDAQGNSVGEVTLSATEQGVMLAGTLTGLSPGEHGFHIHETGRCEPPSFKSAGGHFEPAGRQHGFEHPEGPHAGDLWNLVVSEDSSATVVVTDTLVTLREGENALLDGDGAALVVHPGPDDYRTQPSGDSGSPIACGVIEG